MNSMGAFLVGLFLLLVGCGLTLWSYVNRDQTTGEFFVWWKMILGGVVSLVVGVVVRKMEDQPL